MEGNVLQIEEDEDGEGELVSSEEEREHLAL